MSKSCCFAFVLAVICLSLEADAQPTVDETMTCGSSTSDEVLNMFKTIALNQKDNAKDIKEMKNDIKDVKTLSTSKPIECDALEPSKQALVSAFVYNCIPLLIQQNVNGSNFFNRSWAEFKVGFNDSSGNYWLGNELLSQLTVNRRYKLRFDLQARVYTDRWLHAEYTTVKVLSEADNYELLVAGYSGDATDPLTSGHNGMTFTTYDRDNDQDSSKNCAIWAGGGFWYNSCGEAKVNGYGDRFSWYRLPIGGNTGHHLQSSRMWLQCK